MANVLVPVWLFWSILGFILALIGGIAWSLINLFMYDRTDKVLFLDANMRWSLYRFNLKGRDQLVQGKKTYFLSENLGLLSNKGKAFYIFSENNAQPLKIDKHKSEWLSPESLKGVINNKLVQMMLKTKDAFTDSMLLLGAIGGMIAGVASVIILLIQLKVI